MMYLYIYFKDGHIERHQIQRFSDLSQTAKFYYYEDWMNDERGKGKKIRREDIQCVDISPYPVPEYDAKLNSPIITKALQQAFEHSNIESFGDIPTICGYYGRACQVMEKEERANRAICMNCSLAKYAKKTKETECK